MMLFSKDILSRDKGKIVFDVKCSNQLENLITEQGGDSNNVSNRSFSYQKGY